MFVGASNVCMWIYTRKPGQYYCGKPCVGKYCALHNHALNKKERSLAQPCVKCEKNGTRSLTRLCQQCGASRITSAEWYHKNFNKLDINDVNKN